MAKVINPFGSGRGGLVNPATGASKKHRSSKHKSTGGAGSTNPLNQFASAVAPPSWDGKSSAWNPIPKDEPPNNLPFDSRMFRTPSTSGSSLQVGSMSTNAPGTNFTSYFLFNPNEIDKSYNFDMVAQSALPPNYYGGGIAGESAGLVIGAAFSFTLLFDRTFEVWTGPLKAPASVRNGKWGPGPYQYGVQWDIWSIERLLGMYGQWNGGKPQGPPLASIVNVNFADPNNPQTGGFYGGTGALAPGVQGPQMMGHNGPLSFTGWLLSLSTAYTRFDSNMTPTRAAVDVSFSQIYSPGQDATNGLINNIGGVATAGTQG